MSQNLLADRMAIMVESSTLALNARAKKLAADGKTIYNLTAGELASDTPVYIQEAVAKTLSQNKYTPVAGAAILREQIASHARKFYGLDWITPENVVVTAGAKPALYASFLALVNPGDEVIVPIPLWVSYKHLIELVGGVVVEVPTTPDFDLDVDAITARLTTRTKAILINSPHNPTGTIFSKAALTQLAVALNETSVTVIADDIYSKLVFDDSFTLVPTCGFKNILIINGFSKSQALTGWRVGYLIAEMSVAVATTNLLSHMMANTAVPSQNAAIAALARDDRPPAETLSVLAEHRQIVDDAVQQMEGVTYHKPGGSFYAFLDLRKITDNSAAWCEALLDATGVALVPGEGFSAPGFARLSFAADETILRAAMAQIINFVNKAKV